MTELSKFSLAVFVRFVEGTMGEYSILFLLS